ncbi:MAG: beta-lactamase family protein, partial [Acidobacteriota bacterium]|nr:beta-lactamase family protein [Acidobacteriota bacterium]
GFAETAKDEFVPSAKDLKPLRDYLVAHMPERVYPPGTTPSYSNYGAALAGYIVQRVSGKPFDQYIAENIYSPLQMTHSTFDQPLPDAWMANMSNGYNVASKDPKSYEVVQVFPAGSMATTALDMTHFMIAQLQNGEYNGAKILKPATAELMHSRQRAPGNSAALNAMCLGFYEETRNGHRIIGHAGDTAAFHSDLHLMPDANLGFFVSYNSNGKGTVSDRTLLWQKFLDRYFPYQAPPAVAISSAADDAGKVAGQYMASRRLEGNWLSALAMVGETDVTANPDHTIAIKALSGYNGEPMKFVEVAPLVYRNADGQETVAFYRGYDGRMTFGFDFPFEVYQKVGVLESKSFNMLLLYFSLAVIVLTVVFWALAGMIRKHYGRDLLMLPLDRRLRLVARLTCILYLVVIAGFALIVTKFGDPSTSAESLDKWLLLMQILGVLGVIGSLVAGFYAVRVWQATTVTSRPAVKRVEPATAEARESATGTYYVEPATILPTTTVPSRWIWGRMGWTLVALGCLCFAWLLIHLDVLNFNLHY